MGGILQDAILKITIWILFPVSERDFKPAEVMQRSWIRQHISIRYSRKIFNVFHP